MLKRLMLDSLIGVVVGLCAVGVSAKRVTMTVDMQKWDAWAVPTDQDLGGVLNSVEQNGAKVRFIVPCKDTPTTVPSPPPASGTPAPPSLSCAYQIITAR